MKSAEFSVKKIKYIEGLNNADLSFIPALSRRRMSSLDKITAAALKQLFDDNIENIIFASQKGETENLFKIIEQYKTENEVSPAVFPGSVHNAAIGAFLINEKKPAAYNALSAGAETIPAGILTAAVSKYNNTLFVYSDIEDDIYVSLCLYMSKEKAGARYAVSTGIDAQSTPKVKDFAEFFEGAEGAIKTGGYKIERLKSD